MRADRGRLLRTPGIGPVGANAIIRARRKGTLGSLGDLRRIGLRAPEKMAPYILLGGKKPPVQMSLFGGV